MNKKIIVSVIIIIFLGATVILFNSARNSQSILWFIKENPENGLIVKVEYASPFFRGKHRIYIYVNNILLSEIGLHNNGRALSNTNYSFEWRDEGGLIHFYGQHQHELQYLITLNEKEIAIELVRVRRPDTGGLFYQMSGGSPTLWFSKVNTENGMHISTQFIQPLRGSQTIQVYVNNIQLVRTWINNDAIRLNSSNYNVAWNENGILLSFFGIRQSEEQFLIKLKDDEIVYNRVIVP